MYAFPGGVTGIMFSSWIFWMLVANQERNSPKLIKKWISGSFGRESGKEFSKVDQKVDLLDFLVANQEGNLQNGPKVDFLEFLVANQERNSPKWTKK